MEIKTTEEISVTPYEEVSGIKWVRVDDIIEKIRELKANNYFSGRNWDIILISELSEVQDVKTK